jgi:hypothetical protein
MRFSFVSSDRLLLASATSIAMSMVRVHALAINVATVSTTATLAANPHSKAS